MKKLFLLFTLLYSAWGFSAEINFSFTLTNPSTVNDVDGAITARISGIYEDVKVFCFKLDENGELGEEMPLYKLYYDEEMKDYVAIVHDLGVADYTFIAEYQGEEFKETIHLPAATQSNPLSITFTTQNQQGDNLGQITAVITTGSVEPNEIHCFNTDANNTTIPFSSSVYDAVNNTLTVVVSDLPAGEYMFKVDDGTNYLEQSTQVLYQIIALSAEFNVNHVSSSADAEVTTTISGGTNSSVVTFNKHGDPTPISFTSSFDMGTYKKTIIASGLSEGVYELHVAENGFDVYSYVWVGKYGATTTLSVQPDANYGIDASLRYLSRPGYTHYASTNFGNNGSLITFYGTHGGYPNRGREAIKFLYYGLDAATLDTAKLNLWAWHFRNQGFGGGYANEVYVRRIDASPSYNWDEHTITWNTQPVAMTTDQGIISQYGGYTYANVQYTKEVLITDMVKEHLKPEIKNNGFLMGLMTDNKYRSQYFYSSDHTEANKRPKLTLTFTLSEQKPFVSLKKKIDGGFTTLEDDRKLRFIYAEEYTDQDEKLTYKVYNDKHELVMSDVLNTTLSITNKLDVADIKPGQNKITLNIDCCLTCSKYFLLEVTNEKKETAYLRFKTAPKGSNTYTQGHPCF